jgi:hypothetical protein
MALMDYMCLASGYCPVSSSVSSSSAQVTPKLPNLEGAVRDNLKSGNEASQHLNTSSFCLCGFLHMLVTLTTRCTPRTSWPAQWTCGSWPYGSRHLSQTSWVDVPSSLTPTFLFPNSLLTKIGATGRLQSLGHRIHSQEKATVAASEKSLQIP